MKQRIKIDGSFLAAAILLTIALWFMRDSYIAGEGAGDIVLDAFGLLFILKGTMLRMSARGHKKARSRESQALVQTGPYQLVRNPMYLGTLMIGVGFALMLWPLWLVPAFGVFFYLRFIRQIKLEEGYWMKTCPQEFEKYSKKVQRLIPSYATIKEIKSKNIIDIQEALSTFEARAFFILPLVALMFESVQEWVVFGQTDILRTALIFLVTIIAFLMGLWVFIKNNA